MTPGYELEIIMCTKESAKADVEVKFESQKTFSLFGGISQLAKRPWGLVLTCKSPTQKA